ncbi:probable LRR receptor-like serine/threonine-protein kinase At1g12460 [Impatiens glandulifera]|uniref:probable LRR receptor-like serine/threonine-protein kinase At1g12460 n=1 Tax=Impatiens glandulifera TaxID=253017 RepID=UPI001FB0B2A7|nr:probable LRR receptor-like serine/threonine-protein kinase At1g12460 [Impatiens glandulifera]
MMKTFTTHFTRALLLFLFLEFIRFSHSSSSTDEEKEILLQFKGNISNDPMNILRSWHPTQHPCLNYTGVICNSEGNVVKIVLWNTSLGGVLSPALSGLKFLRVLSLYKNGFTGNIPSQYGEIITLRNFNLSTNSLSGSIPDFLGNLPNIRFLDLSKNDFSGEISPAIFRSCSRTMYISLSHNNLTGSIPESISNCINLIGIDFSYNNLKGTFPSQLCNLENLSFLSLRNNLLSGTVEQHQISLCRSLQLLDLGSNMLSDLAPLAMIGLDNLTLFNISNNQFTGDISVVGTCGQSLKILDASRNQLNGEIPSSIKNCISLKYLDLSYNSLSGSIPTGFSDLKSLSAIKLGNNSLDGIIPSELGSIELLQILDLHNLKLTGDIPNNLSNCRYLLQLDLSGNALEGGIPENLNNIPYLEILDLHENRLTGSIPTNLGNQSNIKYLNLSYNHLSGFVPSGLQRFGFFSFFQNPGLCGIPLDIICNAMNHVKSRKPKLTVSSLVAIIAAAVIFIGVSLITIVNLRARRRKRKEEANGIVSLESDSMPLGGSTTGSNVIIGKLVLFSKNLPSNYADWEAGTKSLIDKEGLIGSGSIGTVYRARFDSGISIAVKKVESLRRIHNQEEFEQEIGRLSKLHHPNLVAIQGYYWSSSMKLLLSEFIPNGNLFDNLHNNPELNWPRRFKIALETAKALSYLHHDCKPQVLHLNLKSKNILLDENYQAKLSDYGLGKLLPLLDVDGLTKISHNAVGYVDPQWIESFRISDKSDVYSFGVILLELVTGRKPVESSSRNEVVVLCEYVRRLIESGRSSTCFDRNLRGLAEEDELMQVMKMGLICTSQISSRRPSMAEVVQVLESVSTVDQINY